MDKKINLYNELDIKLMVDIYNRNQKEYLDMMKYNDRKDCEKQMPNYFVQKPFVENVFEKTLADIIEPDVYEMYVEYLVKNPFSLGVYFRKQLAKSELKLSNFSQSDDVFRTSENLFDMVYVFSSYIKEQIENFDEYSNNKIKIDNLFNACKRAIEHLNHGCNYHAKISKQNYIKFYRKLEKDLNKYDFEIEKSEIAIKTLFNLVGILEKEQVEMKEQDTDVTYKLKYPCIMKELKNTSQINDLIVVYKVKNTLNDGSKQTYYKCMEYVKFISIMLDTETKTINENNIPYMGISEDDLVKSKIKILGITTSHNMENIYKTYTK